MDRIMGVDAQALFSWAVQLISTGVLVFFLYKILYNPALKFLDARAKRISDTITNADDLMKTATAMKADYEEKLKTLDQERAQILETATKRAKEREEEIISEAKATAEKLKATANASIEMEKQKAQSEMKSQIIDISALIAQKYVAGNIDQSVQNKLLDEIITDLGDATWLN